MDRRSTDSTGCSLSFSFGRSISRDTALPTIISVSSCGVESFVTAVVIDSPLRRTVTRSEISITSASL